ncbi:MAG: protein kinase [Rubripirellula sp.]|nr:protein kinase [Rubripirellula sp.]
MNPGYLNRLETAFNEAITLVDPAQKTSYLEDLAKRDSELERELRTLLALKDESEEFFESREGDYASLLTTTMRVTKRIEKVDEFLAFLAQVSGPVAAAEIASVRGFYLNNLIATGPTGFVFHGRDPQLCRDVAIKVLAPSIALIPEQKQTFIDEARLASTVLHDNVVLIHHISAEPDSPLVFYAMEWINGSTLQEWIEHHPQPMLHRDHSLSLFRQIADGLGAIHQHGIVHRDLKPANLMLDVSQKRLKIVDFGIAFEATEDLVQSGPVGTPLYMSPEQLQTGTGTQRSDIFSLAEIACVLISGRHPFAETSIERLTQRVQQGSLDLPTAKVGCGPAAQAVLRKALSTDPASRYSTAAEFSGELLNAMKPTGGNETPAVKTSGEIAPVDVANPIDSASPIAKQSEVLSRTQRSWRIFTVSCLAVALLGIGLMSLRNWSRSDRAEQSSPMGLPGSTDVVGTPAADVVAAGRWEDQDHFLNFVGMQLTRIPEVADSIDTWPIDPDHPELFRNLGWKNMDRDQWLGANLVTQGQYLEVMGPREQNADDSLFAPDAQVTDVTFREAEAFCERLTEMDPDGIRYRVCNKNAWTMATYGYKMIAEDTQSEAMLRTFRELSRGESIEDQPLATRPLIEGVFGSTWEWMLGGVSKPVVLDGVVSYRERPEIPSLPFYELLGGGSRDLFVHAHDMNYGMNDNLYGSHNLRFHLESDGETCYLTPGSVGERGWVSYRYRFKKELISARIRHPFFLYQDGSSAGIRMRFSRRPNEEPLEECEWHTILAVDAPLVDNTDQSIDISSLAKGAVEIEVEYWLEAVTTPLWEVQLGRTVYNANRIPRRGFYFQAVTNGREESMRQTVQVPEDFRSPLIGFRVDAYFDEALPAR